MQHPLAGKLDGAGKRLVLTLRAAALYDAKQPCGAEANAAKFLGARAAFDACNEKHDAPMAAWAMRRAIGDRTSRSGGADMIPRLAPVSEQLILSFIAENVLDLAGSHT